MADSNSLPVDHPITSSEDDVLGRAIVARDFARSVRELDAPQGLVVGVLGAWGHGKSSFVNLMREEFAEAPALPVIEFNPWVFSGDQQLTDVFFREIAAELRLKDQSKCCDDAPCRDSSDLSISQMKCPRDDQMDISVRKGRSEQRRTARAAFRSRAGGQVKDSRVADRA